MNMWRNMDGNSGSSVEGGISAGVGSTEAIQRW